MSSVVLYAGVPLLLNCGLPERVFGRAVGGKVVRGPQRAKRCREGSEVGDDLSVSFLLHSVRAA